MYISFQISFSKLLNECVRFCHINEIRNNENYTFVYVDWITIDFNVIICRYDFIKENQVICSFSRKKYVSIESDWRDFFFRMVSVYTCYFQHLNLLRENHYGWIEGGSRPIENLSNVSCTSIENIHLKEMRKRKKKTVEYERRRRKQTI